MPRGVYGATRDASSAGREPRSQERGLQKEAAVPMTQHPRPRSMPAAHRPRTRRTRLAVAGLLAAALSLAAPLRAQVTPPPADTARAAPPPANAAPRDTTPGDTLGGISPRGAFLRSLVLPGWGQSEIGSPGRGGIYFALESASLWMVYKTGRKVREAERREASLRATGQLGPDDRTGLLRDRRAQREDWITLSVFFLFFSGADAFVAAHLRDFDAHLGAIPTPDGGVQIQATIPTP